MRFSFLLLALVLTHVQTGMASPVIPGAERLNDPVERGQVLVDALNCTACHDVAPFEAVAPVGAPEFDGTLSHRYTLKELKNWIGNPHDVKPGTRMPDLFGDTTADQFEVSAIAQFLYSMNSPPEMGSALPEADPKAGAELFHRIGCIACHAPDPGHQLEMTGPADPDSITQSSVPIELAKKWPLYHLAHWLQDPTSEAMPDFHLTDQESVDLAAWILKDAEPPSQEMPTLDSQMIAQGSGLYLSRGCAKCHGNPPGVPAQAGRIRRKLIPANSESGCLADETTEEAPDFRLSDQQRSDIRAAVTAEKVSLDEIHTTLAALNCTACHERDGIGGPEAGRRPYFGVDNEMALSLGDFGQIPPKLDKVGRKITRPWMEGLLEDGEDLGVRPYIAARMPAYQHDSLSPLIDYLAEADALEESIEMDTSGLAKHHRGHYGRDLMGVQGLACVTCHGLKGQPALGAPLMELTRTVERIQPEYFKELLLDPANTQPGTLMPPLFINRPKADQEVEQIWTYLKELDQRRLPDGLLKTEDFVLDPAKEERPMVFRTFIEGAGMQAIAVGFPEGIHAAFDPLELQWALAWRGGFLNAMSTWDERASTPTIPLSDDVLDIPLGDAPSPDSGFEGYSMDKEGNPTFLYRLNGVDVEDRIRPAEDGQSLIRTIRKGDQETEEIISW